MTYFDQIHKRALECHYLYTTSDAMHDGIPVVELAKLAYRGKLESMANGVYRIVRYIPDDFDAFALAVARVGDGAFLYGKSALMLHDLVPAKQDVVYVGTYKRVRKQLPQEIIIKHVSRDELPITCHGIKTQAISRAILVSRETMDVHELLHIVHVARTSSLISSAEATMLLEELR